MARKPLILAIDDDKNIRLLLERALRDDYGVITAQNGREGLDKVRSESPDLVLLDIMMPVLNGYEVCSEIRKDPIHGRLPVIMLTSKDAARDEIKGLGTGADYYMPKPFDLDELKARIRLILGKKPPPV